MAKPAKTKTEEPVLHSKKLRRLTVRNFRAIGPEGVTIDLDDIVILVGPNNVGKSSILRAFEVAMANDADTATIEAEDFPESKCDGSITPEIEVETIVMEPPGERWVFQDDEGNNVVRERWLFDKPGKGKRQGFDVQRKDWAEDGVPWGADNIAGAHRVEPHRVDAFADPAEHTKQVVALLKTVLTERVQASQGTAGGVVQGLLDQITSAQKQLAKEAQTEITRLETELTSQIEKIFPGFAVEFDPQAEEGADKALELFKSGGALKMGPKNGFMSTVGRQGSGARRALLWTALRILAGTKFAPGKKTGKGAKAAGAPGFVLLIDEPEICLHPNAIREACAVLYDLPSTGKWQVMATTHSPAFVDLSRNNTTIVRVDRPLGGAVSGTTVFRPEKVQLTDDEREQLKLMNIYDPYVAEFFFGGRTIVVEGDTEYSAFRHVVHERADLPRDIHVIRARGKATIVPLMKILNHFGSAYGVLHDSDQPQTATKKKNPAWTMNQRILETAMAAPDQSKVRVLASIKNFEAAFLENEVTEEKPYNAIQELKGNDARVGTITELIKALLDPTLAPPKGAMTWATLEELEKALAT